MELETAWDEPGFTVVAQDQSADIVLLTAFTAESSSVSTAESGNALCNKTCCNQHMLARNSLAGTDNVLGVGSLGLPMLSASTATAIAAAAQYHMPWPLRCTGPLQLPFLVLSSFCGTVLAVSSV